MEGHTIAAFHHNETWPKVGNECSSTTLRAWITMQIACVAVAIICILLEWVTMFSSGDRGEQTAGGEPAHSSCRHSQQLGH
jgi:hypothetical protein